MTAPPLNSTWSFTPTNATQINSVSISDDGSKCAFGSSYERGSGTFYTYLFDGSGTQIWKKPISAGASYQGVFWVAVSGDGNYVASGGETVDTQTPQTNETPPPVTNPGYLQAFTADSTGTELLNNTPSARINQVSLSHDGKYLVACYGQTMEVYCLNEDNSKYKLIHSHVHTSNHIKSCVISKDGSTVVASGIQYIKTQTPKGSVTSFKGNVYSYSISGNTVSTLGTYPLADTGCMRVAITANGSYWAASLHDGSCLIIKQDKPNDCFWHCAPVVTGLMLAYAVAITQTDTGEVYVACGANLDHETNGGFLYLVKSTRMVYDENNLKYPAPYYKGIIQWSKDIKFGVNPGVSMDKNATYVTATDGKPDGNSRQESKGSFYLFSGASGNMIWKNDTSMMNWPMMISYDASAIIGGSDEGSVYYWAAPYS